MLENLSFKLINYLTKETTYTSIEKEHMKYALMTLLNELSKTIVLILLFTFIGELRFFAIACFFSLLLKIYIGGFHQKGYWQCFLFTTLYFLVLLYFVNFSLLEPIHIAVSILSILIVLIFAPVTSPQRRVKKERANLLKVTGFLVSMAYVIGALYFQNYYTRIALYALVLQTVLIVLRKGRKLNEKLIENFYK